MLLALLPAAGAAALSQQPQGGPTSPPVPQLGGALPWADSPELRRCPWLVEFYSPACGVCRAYAPVFAAAAARLWQDTEAAAAVRGSSATAVGVAAVDCDRHSHFCGQQRLSSGVPALRVYPPGAPPADLDTRRPMPQTAMPQLAELLAAARGAARAAEPRCGALLLRWRAAGTAPAPRPAPAPRADAQAALCHALQLSGAPPSSWDAARRALAHAAAAHLPEAAALLAPANGSAPERCGRLEWAHCAAGGEGTGGGLPCGLWLLFHSLVAAGGRPALDAVLGWCAAHLGCPDCRTHWAGLVAAHPPPPQPAAGGAPEWLWRAHNAVSARLRRPEWPPAALCPRCRGAGGAWDLPAVRRFLDQHYGPAVARS
eukprot:TRINITY_DN29218_c0_g1_i2.p1 TRINITY_DN29218_c0_g1~~TRINITY_DN29218_c0_g1_i2.p1  ORF type:complete len:372 (+),score=76.23 TRINITY_DN29218_c0_g1_i2:91-1206(+)